MCPLRLSSRGENETQLKTVLASTTGVKMSFSRAKSITIAENVNGSEKGFTLGE